MKALDALVGGVVRCELTDGTERVGKLAEVDPCPSGALLLVVLAPDGQSLSVLDLDEDVKSVEAVDNR